MGICCTRPEFNPPGIHRKPIVRMCSSGNHFSNFADIGDTVVLFVDFVNITSHWLAVIKGIPWAGPLLDWCGLINVHHDTEHEQYEVSIKMSDQHLIFPRQGTLQKYGWGCVVRHFLKPLPYFIN